MLQKYNNSVFQEPKPCWFSPVDINSETDLNLCCQVGAINYLVGEMMWTPGEL